MHQHLLDEEYPSLITTLSTVTLWWCNKLIPKLQLVHFSKSLDPACDDKKSLCLCVCWYETERQRELGCLQKLIHPINHSIWFLFIFRSPTVIPASHWALYALPRRFPPQPPRAVQRAFRRNLERAWVPALLRYFTVPKLYGQIPSDLSLVKAAACGRAGIPASHVRWFMSTQ